MIRSLCVRFLFIETLCSPPSLFFFFFWSTGLKSVITTYRISGRTQVAESLMCFILGGETWLEGAADLLPEVPGTCCE